ncbi:phosphotransferase [Microbacterium sp. 2FI]|uniref:phosphotransferase n=1 Tax=Microbacterium sp. 2FI TaxID=2502193 RepID=UPI0010F84BEB|nr:phosphotransferase [Microbacterium sp. 2FI]
MTAELEADAADVVGLEWARRPTAVRRVSSDVEETFLVAFGDGTRAVLKVAEPGRGADWFAFEADLVEQALERDAALPLARGIRTPDGRALATVDFAGGPRTARLMQHLAGVAAVDARPDAAARRRIGRTAGRLSRALAGVTHPVALRRVPWDLRDLAALAPAAGLVVDPIARALVEHVLDAHAGLVESMAELPEQLSHNDLNGGNILVSPDDPGFVSGIIDFGDAAHAPRVLDVGIAAAYAAAESAAASTMAGWDAAVSVTAGYAEEAGLTSAEIALVPAVARARLAQRVLVAASRRAAPATTPTRDDEEWFASTLRDLIAVASAPPGQAAEAPKEWR